MVRTRKLYKLVLTANHIIKTLEYLRYNDYESYLNFRRDFLNDYHFLIKIMGIIENMHYHLRLEA